MDAASRAALTTSTARSCGNPVERAGVGTGQQEARLVVALLFVILDVGEAESALDAQVAVADAVIVG